MKFILEGKTFDMSRADVAAKMRGESPKRIQQLAVDIDGRWFPVRQVLGKITNRSPQSLNSGRSMRIMRRFGFTVHDIRRDGPLGEAGSGAASASGIGSRSCALLPRSPARVLRQTGLSSSQTVSRRGSAGKPSLAVVRARTPKLAREEPVGAPVA